ncbi:hypothetical protein [Beijerinckia sp. L45]|uniref:hypothetical protein n=1 Tax=Beijerinckia sp. L45 TaxID=1641855 RepID=UPI00131D0704|nr:hypothetical protein [Beijerinckia sp. L45]
MLDAWQHLIRLTRPALLLAPRIFLEDVSSGLEANGIQSAVAQHDSAAIVDWILTLANLQGISDRAAASFAVKHGDLQSVEIYAALAARPSCPRLRHYWAFSDCGYRKSADTCSEPHHLPLCPLPRHPLRKGALNQAAISLALFVRDVCDGDLVSWIDVRLAAADPGKRVANRAALMRAALLEPLSHVYGIGPKLWSMTLADLLLGGDPKRERWTTTGASMIAIDSLIHNVLHRIGILDRFDAAHVPGPGCYAPGGCADLISGLASRIDAREFDADFPACFPRFVQYAIWHFCAEGGWGICNGRRIDDRHRCDQQYCPSYRSCDRLALKLPTDSAQPAP